MTVGILVLAAGQARRFGSDKRVAHLPGGGTVLQTQLANANASGLPIMVCLSPEDDNLAQQLQRANIRSVHCHRAHEGMGSTLAEGIRSISDWQGVLIALADMPWVMPETYLQIASAVRYDGICLPVYAGQRGHPVGFGCDYFDALSRSSGAAGARVILSAHTTSVEEIPVTDGAVLLDIDRPADLHRRP